MDGGCEHKLAHQSFAYGFGSLEACCGQARCFGATQCFDMCKVVQISNVLHTHLHFGVLQQFCHCRSLHCWPFVHLGSSFASALMWHICHLAVLHTFLLHTLHSFCHIHECARCKLGPSQHASSFPSMCVSTMTMSTLAVKSRLCTILHHEPLAAASRWPCRRGCCLLLSLFWHQT